MKIKGINRQRTKKHDGKFKDIEDQEDRKPKKKIKRKVKYDLLV